MPSDSGRAVRCAPEHAHEAIHRFLSQAKQPVLIEPGEPEMPLQPGCYDLSLDSGRLTIQAWTEDRNLSRRITAVSAQRPGRLTLAIERFGKRPGVLELVDSARPQAKPALQRGSRLAFRERFRRMLSRQFPGWEITELTADPDLQHSFSPAFPRAFLKKGNVGVAAIGAAPDRDDAPNALTFGLIWHDYLRRRENRLQIRLLALFLPEAALRITALRIVHLDQTAAEYRIWAHGEDGMEHAADIHDFGNLDTTLAICRTSVRPHTPDTAGIERIDTPDGELSFRVHGLEVGRTQGGELRVGIDGKYHPVHPGELEALAREVEHFRSAGCADHANPLYRRNPERWLESQVRAGIRDVDASLLSGPVYGQVPAFAGGDRSVIDLLACTAAGRLCVIELKASEDPHLPLQALDYWMRVNWHVVHGDFARGGYFPGVPLLTTAPKLLLVAPSLHFHPSVDVILRYFSPSIDVERIGVGMDWRSRISVMFCLKGAETRR